MKTENFEAKMEKLEKIVSELEKGDQSLEEALKIFEDGMKISKECNSKLEDAEKRITVLIEENNNLKEEDFTTEG